MIRKVLPRVLVSVIFLAFLVYFIRKDLPQVLNCLRDANHPMLLATVFFSFLGVLSMAVRLRLIFRAEGIRLTLGETSDLTYIGYFFNNFLPSSVGGDVVKIISAARVTGDKVRSVTSVLMDRIFGLFVFILIPSISLIFYLKQVHTFWVPLIVYSLLGVSVAACLLIFNRDLARKFGFVEKILNVVKLGPKVRSVYDGLHNFKNHKLVILQAMLLSVLGQSVSILVLYFFATALGARTSPIYFFLLIPVVHLVSMVPVSFGGLGVRESAYVYFLKDYIGQERAFALGIVWLSLLVLTSLIGGIIYFCKSKYHIRFQEAEAAV